VKVSASWLGVGLSDRELADDLEYEISAFLIQISGIQQILEL